jgi:hypothetical protein
VNPSLGFTSWCSVFTKLTVMATKTLINNKILIFGF